MAETIRLRVITPSRVLVDEEVDEVTAPGALGQFGVLPNHAAFFSQLEAGELSYKQGSTREYMAIGGGYAEVLDDVMTVLADSAELAGEIDAERALRAKDKAEGMLKELDRDDKGFAVAEAALHRALVRLQVAAKEARR